VLLINGDSHVYRVDHPMEPSSPYYGFHPSSIGDVTNFTRLTVQGSTNPMEWVKLTLIPRRRLRSPSRASTSPTRSPS